MICNLTCILLVCGLFQASCTNFLQEEGEQGSIIRAGDRVQAAGDPASAIKVYESALKQDPPHKLPLYLKLGEAYMNADQLDEAKRIYGDALPYDENNEVKMQLGRLYLSTGQADAALSIFEKILAFGQDNPKALNGMGIAHDLRTEHDLAQGCYRKALLLNEGNKDIQSNLGLSLAFEGKYDEAFKWLQPVGESPTATSKQRHNLALVYALAGDNARSQDLFSRDMNVTEINENFHMLQMVARPPVSPRQKSAQEPVKQPDMDIMEEPDLEKMAE